MQRKGFTLIELLVSVAIIVVLIAVLLPSLSQARKQAQIVSCLANMRSLGQAQSTYINEYNGAIASTWYFATNPRDWHNVWDRLLAPYLNLPVPALASSTDRPPYSKVFQCPRDFRRAESYWPAARSYFLSAGNSTYPKMGVQFRKITEIVRPGTTIVFAEAHLAGPATATRSLQYRPDNSYFIGWLGITSIGTVGGDGPYSHGKKMGFLFADFHVSNEDPTMAYRAKPNWWTAVDD